MKKIIIVLLCCLVSTSVMAQSVKFGVKAGGNINTTAHPRPLIDGTKKNSFYPGFCIGGVMNLSFSERLQLETNILYSLKGNKSHMQSVKAPAFLVTPYSFDYTVKRHYISLPVSVKFYPISNLYVECGPEFSYRVGLNYNACETVESAFNNKFDFGVLCGIGYDINEHLFVNARYTHGLINEYSEKYPLVKDSEQNRCIQLSVGYMF